MLDGVTAYSYCSVYVSIHYLCNFGYDVPDHYPPKGVDRRFVARLVKQPQEQRDNDQRVELHEPIPTEVAVALRLREMPPNNAPQAYE